MRRSLRQNEDCRQYRLVLIDPTGSFVVSNLGWVDRGAIWVCDGVGTRPRTVPIDDARYIRLTTTAESGRLAIQHETKHGWRVSCRDWWDLSRPVCEVDVLGWAASVEGDLAAFGGTRSLHVSYMDDNITGAAGYFLLEIAPEGCRVRRLDWFDDAFDSAYQSVISALTLPNGEYVFGVQRCSDLFICDPGDLSTARPLRLAGSGGNPVPFLRNHGAELWALDYDTLVRISTQTFTVEGSWRGQEPRDGVRMFLGEAWLSPDEARVLVARPGTGDVVEIDPAAMSVRRSWTTGRQPLSAAKLKGELIARDWKSGDLLDTH